MIGLKKCTAALLSILLIISMTGTAVAEQSETAPREQQETVAKAADSSGVIENDDMPTGYVPDEHIAIPLLSEDWTPPELLSNPVSFDLRNVNGKSYVTSVKNQSPYGTCWSFAFCAAAESNLLMKGFGNYDLSELQLAYFTTVRNEATAAAGGGTAGDIVTDNEDLLDHGGNSHYAMGTVSNWIGFANESDLPYVSANFSKVYSRSVEQNDADIAYNKDSVHVQNVYAVSLADRAIVKNMLQTYGAATISYYHISSRYNSNMTASYQNNIYSTNHAVTLVGWDDSYAVSNFNSACRPSLPGAWLCKNSWGSSWNSAGGYFYISYEDAAFLNNPNTSANDPGQVYFVDCIPTGKYGNIYQYDGGIGWGYLGYSNTAYAANVFAADADESISAVSFYTGPSIITDISISIYTNVISDPSSGTKVLEQTVEKPVGSCFFSESYYTVPLNSLISVAGGSKFAVVVRYSNYDYDVYVLYDRNADYGQIFYNTNITSHTESHSGESYMSANGSSWTDVSVSYGNLRIKAKTARQTISTVYGDVNCDNYATISDAILIARHVAGIGTIPSYNFTMADVCPDGVLDIKDIISLCWYAVGKTETLPFTPPV